MLLSGNFSQAASWKNEHSSPFVRIKSFLRVPLSIVSSEHIESSLMKQERPKTRAVTVPKRDIRWVTLFEELKHESFALDGFVQDNSDLHKRNMIWVFFLEKLKGESFAFNRSIQDNSNFVLVSNLSIRCSSY